MTMGEYIKRLRNEHGRMTQEELGQLLRPQVNRAAINKWENGQVENIKRSYIEQMAIIFNVRPCELMCFENDIQQNPEATTKEYVQNVYGNQALTALTLFNQLNETGKNKALEDLDDLTQIPKYTEDSPQGGLKDA